MPYFAVMAGLIDGEFAEGVGSDLDEGVGLLNGHLWWFVLFST